MFYDNAKCWDDITKVIVLTTNDLDHKLAALYACYEMKQFTPEIEITLFDCSNKAKIPPVLENPTNDTIVLFLGYMPSMAYLENTINMVQDRHIIYIDNDETKLHNLYNMENAKWIGGITIPRFSISVLTYWYFTCKMRYAGYHRSTRVFCTKYDRPLDLVDPIDVQKMYKVIDWQPIKDVDLFTMNPMKMDSTILGRCIIYNMRLGNSFDNFRDPETKCKVEAPIEDEYILPLEEFIVNNRNIMKVSYSGKLRKCEHFKVKAINTSEATIFNFINNKDWNNYHIGVSFTYNGNMWYKVWRLGKDPEKFINIRKIVESFGGHGSENYGEFKTSGQLEVIPI